MKPDERLRRQHEVLKCLSNLPRMILLVNERNDIPAFVLHELCHPACFNLSKAAFFVDNPDFDFLRGIVGLNRNELDHAPDDIWQNPEDFSDRMEQSHFNQQVRGVDRLSVKRNGGNEQELIADMADHLGLGQLSACYWNMKHDNYGILIFEKAAFDDEDLEEYLINGASMLSFCPLG